MKVAVVEEGLCELCGVSLIRIDEVKDAMAQVFFFALGRNTVLELNRHENFIYLFFFTVIHGPDFFFCVFTLVRKKNNETLKLFSCTVAF